jgi:PAS domain S-box-containing protein
MADPATPHPFFLAGGNEMGELIRRHPWADTPIGAPEAWPQALKTAVGIMLNSGYAMYIAWGRSFTQLYNDAYRPILGATKHPAALGSSTADTFSEIWDFIGPMFRGVLEEGATSTYVDQLLLLERYGFAEECYFTFSYSAIPSENGVGGVLVTCLETTERVLAERRHQVLRQVLESHTQQDVSAVVEAAMETLARDPADMPFVVALRPDGGGGWSVAASTGLQGPALGPVIDEALAAAQHAQVGVLRAVDLGDGIEAIGCEVGAVRRMASIGVAPPGAADPAVVLVMGLSPRLAFAERYADFLVSVAANLAVKVSEAQAFEHERRRAAELAEIDRAKTVFFSDVSHEFRTPITLMMGPLDEAIEATSGELRDSLQIARRNAGRLLKLVNSLLDFSRIEAGRMQARFETVDLAQLTVELASNFRSAIELAGLRLDVDCPALDTPVCVDTSMWEKIVLNLVSNAFKHTFSGCIAVRLRQHDGIVRLEVSDTGIGIPAEQLALVFERFRRVPNARSRTHEGSGIGLALVRELARMHGGDVRVDSREGVGSTFTVTIDSALAPSTGARSTSEPFVPRGQSPGTAAYVDEALRWLPDAPYSTEQSAGPGSIRGNARILVADDNADMREYLGRLIAQRWEVRTCNDGEAALELARTWQPDLLLSDVMMPKLDGFELISRLREHADTASLPVVLLSARAGEDARIEGLRAGAEDYLVKPFTARDLYARVENQLMRAQARKQLQEAGDRLQRLFAQAPVAIALLQGPDFTFAIANPPYCELVGRTELLGRQLREAIPELEGQGIFELLEQVRDTKAPVVAHSRHVRVNRYGKTEDGWFSFVYQPILDRSGETEAVLVVVYEVTELAKAKQAAEVANFAKDEFLAMLGHELRNPLAPIVTALQIMRLRHGDEMVREREVIERQVAHLMGLVDDLLDVSRVTQGKIELRRQRLEMAEVVAAALEQAAPLIEKRHHRLEVDAPASGLLVEGDEKRLSQVITNLLTNAAKFTPDGGRIRVVARAEGDEVVVQVSDNGVGIEAETLSRVFDMFFQARTTFDRRHGGLGLGLAIVRNLVALHGGSVSVHSEGRDRGSEFEVRLPCAKGTTPVADRAPTVAERPSGGCDVLIVDDNEDAAESMAELLRLRGHRVATAYDAASALQLAASEHWDAAFLDLGLPGMNGYDLADALWSIPAHQKLPVFAISGYGRAEDRRKTAEAGFAGHLVKPVTAESLEDALNAQRDRGRGHATTVIPFHTQRQAGTQNG